RNVKLAEAPSFGQSIFDYDATCHGANDYRALAEAIAAWSPSAAPAPTVDAPAPAIAPDAVATAPAADGHA
ncbi:MAG: ParA family protein, partial [Pseudomonadota bacterium]